MSDIDLSRTLFCPVLSYRHDPLVTSKREEDSHAGDIFRPFFIEHGHSEACNIYTCEYRNSFQSWLLCLYVFSFSRSLTLWAALVEHHTPPSFYGSNNIGVGFN